MLGTTKCHRIKEMLRFNYALGFSSWQWLKLFGVPLNEQRRTLKHASRLMPLLSVSCCNVWCGDMGGFNVTKIRYDHLHYYTQQHPTPSLTVLRYKDKTACHNISFSCTSHTVAQLFISSCFATSLTCMIYISILCTQNYLVYRSHDTPLGLSCWLKGCCHTRSKS